MNLIFHSNQLGYRGTEVALFDYAKYNELLLGNTSYIMAPSNSDKSAYDKFNSVFPDRVLLYDSISEIPTYIDRIKADYFYCIKAGYKDSLLFDNTKTLVHSVFQHLDPHGFKYKYVSEWLSKKMTGSNTEYVPHIIDLPTNQIANYRSYLNIPETATVFGRYGGYTEFNLNIAKNAVAAAINMNKDIYFLFMNTEPFISHPNVIYLDPVYNLQSKVAFINTCDALIHARDKGETFGLTIGEFTAMNKPVITFYGGEDRAHIDMLGPSGWYYTNVQELLYYLLNFGEIKRAHLNYSALVEQYKPIHVMDKFKQEFLV